MSLGPEKIILILVVALIVFGPQRLPEIARQVGSAIRELRRMQDTVRGELEQVLHPDFLAPDSPASTTSTASSDASGHQSAIEDSNHAVLPPGSYASDMSVDTSSSNGSNGSAHEYSTDDVTDDGFAGPRSFS